MRLKVITGYHTFVVVTSSRELVELFLADPVGIQGRSYCASSAKNNPPLSNFL
jgi:hypothetical protein